MKYAITGLFVLVGFACGQESRSLSLRNRFPLPNVNGRIDHFSADLKGQRIFVSALGNHTIEALDVQSGKHLKTIAGLEEPQGVYYDPSSNRLFVACAKDGATKLFDGDTLQLLETVKFSGDADALVARTTSTHACRAVQSNCAGELFACVVGMTSEPDVPARAASQF
jgi:WD40 repeat protein